MWAVTGWAIATWLRVSLTVAAAVTVGWLAFGGHSAGFVAVCATAVLAEGYLSRQLIREWSDEARHRCWWWWHR